MLYRRFVSSIADRIGDSIGVQIVNLLKQSFVYEKRLFPHTVESDILKKYFTRLAFSSQLQQRTNNRGIVEEQVSYAQDEPIQTQYDFIKYEDVLIICVIKLSFRDSVVCLITHKNAKSIKILNKFSNMLVDESKRYILTKRNLPCFISASGGYFRQQYSIQRRSFNDVFLDDNTEKELVSKVDNFISKKNWYKKHKISYHYGIILYGPPGTGKSSIIQALANKYKSATYILNGSVYDLLRRLDEDEVNTSNDAPTLIVIEDIDAEILSNIRQAPKLGNIENKDPQNIEVFDKLQSERKGMSLFLNKLDGIGALENVIYIFTTNHLEQLDPALKRPGRVDLLLEVGYVTDNSFSKFFKYHYGMKVPDWFHIRNGVTFAELQNKVLENATAQDILNEYRICK